MTFRPLIKTLITQTLALAVIFLGGLRVISHAADNSAIKLLSARQQIAAQTMQISVLNTQISAMTMESQRLKKQIEEARRAPASSGRGCSSAELQTMRNQQDQLSKLNMQILELERQLKNRDSQIDALIRQMKR